MALSSSQMALDGLPAFIPQEAKAQETAGDQSVLPPVCGSEFKLVELGLPPFSTSFSLPWRPNF